MLSRQNLKFRVNLEKFEILDSDPSDLLPLGLVVQHLPNWRLEDISLPLQKNMSKTCILCHLVFGTYKRKTTIPTLSKPILYPYISGIIKNKRCSLKAIGGMPDHIHILIDLNPSVPLAELVRAVKQSSSAWMKEDRLSFPMFTGWGKGYYASSVSPKLKDACIDYITNQELHHGGEGFLNELRYLIEKTGLQWYEDDWD